MFTANELGLLLNVLSLMTNEFRYVIVPNEIDGDALDQLHDRVLAETQRSVGVVNVFGTKIQD